MITCEKHGKRGDVASGDCVACRLALEWEAANSERLRIDHSLELEWLEAHNLEFVK